MKYSFLLLIIFIGSLIYHGSTHRKEEDIVENKNETEVRNSEERKIIKKPNVTMNTTSNYSLYTWEETDQKPKSII